MLKRFLAAFAVILAALITLNACTSTPLSHPPSFSPTPFYTPSTPTPARIYAMGDPIPYTDEFGSATITVHSAHWTTEGGYRTPEPGHSFLAIKLTITTTQGTFVFAPSYHYVLQDTKKYFATTYGSIPYKPALENEELTAPATRHGYIHLQLPRKPGQLCLGAVLEDDFARVPIPA